MDQGISDRFGLAVLDPLDGQASSRSERRDQQVQRVLEAAKACFIRSGFKGASMQEICAEAEMSPGALYRYFPSKEAIVEAICEADRRDDASCFIGMLDNPSVVDGVVYAALHHIRHTHECNKTALFAEIRSESMRNPAIDLTCSRNISEVGKRFHQYLSAAVERGEIDPPVGFETLLPTIMAIGEGMALNDLPGRGVDMDQLEILLRAMVVGMLRPRTADVATNTD
ncbi:MAG: TetR/AcrR family transcriptional regulator [Rhizobiaceae bacterium]|nr:TetR/AcrR family transcriptional regulator [Rhizobiaceae bacterium]